ncbi:unnamed protein product [Prorocentrum cordatum]|uniref:Uncharacterized protein n=1 Tax=Prorocentrum cordatum TaxID=2364126 RepID=A0ABN9QRI3_9DINO|nr:unnamed protein product [Polarella glacialis]
MLASARAQLLTLPRRALVITGCRPIYETTAILAVGAEAGHLSTSSLRQRIRCASISSRQPLCHRSLDCASTQNLELMVGVPKYSTDASNNGAGDILGIRRESERERGARRREGEADRAFERGWDEHRGGERASVAGGAICPVSASPSSRRGGAGGE